MNAVCHAKKVGGKTRGNRLRSSIRKVFRSSISRENMSYFTFFCCVIDPARGKEFFRTYFRLGKSFKDESKARGSPVSLFRAFLPPSPDARKYCAKKEEGAQSFFVEKRKKRKSNQLSAAAADKDSQQTRDWIRQRLFSHKKVFFIAT